MNVVSVDTGQFLLSFA